MGSSFFMPIHNIFPKSNLLFQNQLPRNSALSPLCALCIPPLFSVSSVILLTPIAPWKKKTLRPYQNFLHSLFTRHLWICVETP